MSSHEAAIYVVRDTNSGLELTRKATSLLTIYVVGTTISMLGFLVSLENTGAMLSSLSPQVFHLFFLGQSFIYISLCDLFL